MTIQHIHQSERRSSSWSYLLPDPDASSSQRHGYQSGTSRSTLQAFLIFLAFDATASVLLVSPLFPKLQQIEDVSYSHYSLHRSLIDLGILAALRVGAALYAVLYSFFIQDQICEDSHPDLFAENGDRKCDAQLQEESLEQPLAPKITKYIQRPAFFCEMISFISAVFLVVKCLVRLDIEIASGGDIPKHPAFWSVLLLSAICSVVESRYIDCIEAAATECGHEYRRRAVDLNIDVIDGLADPLLPGDRIATPPLADEENGVLTPTRFPNGDVRGRSEIRAESNYKAKFEDLLAFCAPDKYLLMLAFLLLLGAALTSVYIPLFTGAILDSLVTNANSSSGENGHSITKIPGFVSNMKKLVVAAILSGILSSSRGALFAMVKTPSLESREFGLSSR